MCLALVPYLSDPGMSDNLTVAAGVLWGKKDKEFIYAEQKYDLMYFFFRFTGVM